MQMFITSYDYELLKQEYYALFDSCDCGGQFYLHSDPKLTYL